MLRHIKMLFSLFVAVALVPAALAQSDARVTGWYDGIDPGDGVTHGTGYIGIGPSWPLWEAPAGSPPGFRWASHIVTDPTGTNQCSNYGGSFTSSIIPLTNPADPGHETSLYVFGKAFDNDGLAPDDTNPPYAKYGPLQDAQGYIVRYANGRYDNVQDTLFLPNRLMLHRLR